MGVQEDRFSLMIVAIMTVSGFMLTITSNVTIAIRRGRAKGLQHL